MSGSTRVASIRLSTEDLDAARAKMEALGSLGDQVLERITQAGHRATAAVSGIADGGDAYTRRAADIAAYRVELDRLRGKFDPLFAASKRYEATLEEIAYAERVGAINASVAARARDATTKAFADAVAPTGVAAAATAVLAGFGRTVSEVGAVLVVGGVSALLWAVPSCANPWSSFLMNRSRTSMPRCAC